ncbi:hypothetical protein DHEL01_v203784 [Diaporthe helianthi]|uniref:Uncharacterized protein n=1 Tax=Diaporthe helianthi TaxID=158607 RepID=A0A2P5I5K8_DIAHE|nr:hypothetical protein DHEL01_v203784 [Diaporthe helianthi]
MSGIGLQSSAKVNEPKKRTRQSKAKKKGRDSTKPIKDTVAATHTIPQASTHRSELGESSTRSIPDRGLGLSHDKNPESQPLSGRLQADRGQERDDLTSASFQRMERQSLRRRKVEALESLAHTAALFLAEFIDFKIGRQEPLASGSPPTAPERQSAGAAYAAAAASLFRPLSEEFDLGDHDSVGSVVDQPSSSPDGSDDEDIQAETINEEKEEMDMDVDNGESDQLPPKLLASFGNGEQAGANELGVKIEEHWL